MSEMTFGAWGFAALLLACVVAVAVEAIAHQEFAALRWLYGISAVVYGGVLVMQFQDLTFADAPLLLGVVFLSSFAVRSRFSRWVTGQQKVSSKQ